MKAKCAICNKELSEEIDSRFEKFNVGRSICKKCGSTQKRYISEVDLLLYLVCIETIYTLLTILAAYTYDNMNNNYFLIFVFLLALVSTYFIQKTISRYIYNNAPFKKETANKIQNEDSSKIKKNINTQFIIFFFFAVGAIMSKKMRIDFIIGLFLDILITLLRFIQSIRNEK